MKTPLSILTTIIFGLLISAPALAQKPSKDPMDSIMADFQSGQTAKGMADLEEIIKLHPDNADALLLRGALRFTSGDINGARSDIDKVIQLKPDLGTAYYQRVMLRLGSNDIDGALKDLDLAIANKYAGDGVYSLRAQLRAQHNDIKGAIADMNEAINLNQDNPRYYLSRSDFLISLDDKDHALADLTYVLSWYETDPSKRMKPKPAHPEVQKNASTGSGEAATKPGPNTFRVEIAEETVNPTPGDKEMIPDIAVAYVKRGQIYSKQGNSAAAIADFTKSIKLSPTINWAFYDRAIELEGKGDLAGALSDIDNAIALDKKNGNVLVERGVILQLLGRTAEAQDVFDMLLNSDRVLWQKRINERMTAVRSKLPSVAH